MEDASLSDFLDEPGEGGDSHPTDGSDADSGPSDDAVGTPGEATSTEAATTGPVPTYEWSPEPTACAECGEAVERRWRSDAGPVCPDCADW